MKILFISLGCDKNLVDTEVMLGMLASRGYEMTNDEQEADIIVINTCCFIHDAKEESIQNILEMAEYKKNGSAKALITPESRFMAMYDDLAVGAAMQNLLIRAAELGLGTLWIGNTGYAYEELIRFVGTEHRLVGAVALGWPDEAPKARPRKPLADVMEWREE